MDCAIGLVVTLTRCLRMTPWLHTPWQRIHAESSGIRLLLDGCAISQSVMRKKKSVDGIPAFRAPKARSVRRIAAVRPTDRRGPPAEAAARTAEFAPADGPSDAVDARPTGGR